jgi:biopolymer transport protein ExbD
MIFKRHCTIARGKLDIAPLIDVVLLLLIFFMLSSSMIQPTGLSVNLPASEVASMQPGDKVRIAIDESGALLWRGNPVEKAELEKRLEMLFAAEPETLIILEADKEVSHGSVVEVMSLIRLKGLKRLAIAAERKSGGAGSRRETGKGM